MAQEFIDSIDLTNHQILNFVVHSSTVAPGVPTAGMMWWDSDKSIMKHYNGSAWLNHITGPEVTTVGKIPQWDNITGSKLSIGFTLQTEVRSVGALDTAIPTELAVRTAIDASVSDKIVDKGLYNASTNSPDLDVNPSGVKKGDIYHVSAAGTFFATAVVVGDVLIANSNNATLESHWSILQKKLPIVQTLATGGTELNISSVSHGQLLIGNGTTGKLVLTDPTGISGVTVTKGAGSLQFSLDIASLPAKVLLATTDIIPIYDGANKHITFADFKSSLGPLGTASTGGSVSDWFEIVNGGTADEYLRCKKPLAGDYEIQAFSDSGQLPPGIWTTIPLASADSPGIIQYNNSQFQTIGGIFQVIPGVLAPGGHQHAWSDITSGVPSFFNAFEYVPNNGDPYLRILIPVAGDYEIQAFSDSGQLPSSIWESLPAATSSSLGAIKYNGTQFETTVEGIFQIKDGVLVPASHNQAWSTITSTPTTISGYGITDAFDGIFSSLSGIPTTKSGYGITDVPGITGTPANNQLAIWTGAADIEGDSDVTWDGTTLTIVGNIIASGEISAFAGSAPDNWWDSMPLATTTTIGGIKYNGTQFETTVGGVFQIKSSVIIPALHDNTYHSTAYAPIASPSFTGSVTWGELVVMSASGLAGTINLPSGSNTSLTFDNTDAGSFTMNVNGTITESGVLLSNKYAPLVNPDFIGYVQLTANNPYFNNRTNSAGTFASPVHRKYKWSKYTGDEVGSIDLLDHLQEGHITAMVFSTTHSDGVIYEDMRLADGFLRIGTTGWSHDAGYALTIKKNGAAATDGKWAAFYDDYNNYALEFFGPVGVTAAAIQSSVASTGAAANLSLNPNGGNVIIGGNNINYSGDFHFKDAGANDVSAVRLFSNGSNLYAQYGSGGEFNVRNATGGIVSTFNGYGQHTNGIGEFTKTADNSSVEVLKLVNAGSGVATGAYMNYFLGGTNYGRIESVYNSTGGAALQFYPDYNSFTSPKLIVNDTGVGIGTVAPDEALEVAGIALFNNSAGTKATGGGLRIVAPIANTHYNWLIGAQENVNAAFEITPSTAAGGTTFSTPAVTIKSDGKVGIGTTDPGSTFDVNGEIRGTSFIGRTYPYTTLLGSAADATATNIRAGSTSGLRTAIDLYGGNSDYPNIITFVTASVERMRITATGNVTFNAASISNDGIYTWGSSNAYGILTWDTDKAMVGARSGKYLELFANGSVYATLTTSGFSVTGTITATGEVTAYYSSDIRLKQNIQSFSALNIIDRLQPKTFIWNDKARELNNNKDNRNNYGLIAQDVEKILPELIHPIYEEYKAVDYIQLVPILLQAIKELRTEIMYLKDK